MSEPGRTVQGLDINGAQILHAEEIGPDDWRAVDFERTAGLSRYTWQGMISRIAELTAAGHVSQLLPGWSSRLAAAQPVYPGANGYVWRDGLYLPPGLWLVQVIPPYPARSLWPLAACYLMGVILADLLLPRAPVDLVAGPVPAPVP